MRNSAGSGECAVHRVHDIHPRLRCFPVSRTLQGHRSSCTAVQVHPFNNIVASGSLDTNVKVRAGCCACEVSLFPPALTTRILAGCYTQLWDVRKRHEFITFKGHSKVIKCVRFSPDGRWVASGAGDSCVKVRATSVLCAVLRHTQTSDHRGPPFSFRNPCPPHPRPLHTQVWDLTAGKLMHTFDTHHGPVGALAFNPFEFLLASGSDDRTVKLWDLERFSLAMTAPFDTQKIRHLAFTPDGGAVLSATVDSLRVVEVGERSSVVANVRTCLLGRCVNCWLVVCVCFRVFPCVSVVEVWVPLDPR